MGRPHGTLTACAETTLICPIECPFHIARWQEPLYSPAPPLQLSNCLGELHDSFLDCFVVTKVRDHPLPRDTVHSLAFHKVVIGVPPDFLSPNKHPPPSPLLGTTCKGTWLPQGSHSPSPGLGMTSHPDCIYQIPVPIVANTAVAALGSTHHYGFFTINGDCSGTPLETAAAAEVQSIPAGERMLWTSSSL